MPNCSVSLNFSRKTFCFGVHCLWLDIQGEAGGKEGEKSIEIQRRGRQGHFEAGRSKIGCLPSWMFPDTAFQGPSLSPSSLALQSGTTPNQRRQCHWKQQACWHHLQKDYGSHSCAMETVGEIWKLQKWNIPTQNAQRPWLLWTCWWQWWLIFQVFRMLHMHDLAIMVTVFSCVSFLLEIHLPHTHTHPQRKICGNVHLYLSEKESSLSAISGERSCLCWKN